MEADYLAYVIMDVVIDTYFLTLDKLGVWLEDFENRAIDENDTTLISDLQRVKQIILQVRQVIWPLRESITISCAWIQISSNLNLNPSSRTCTIM